MPFLSEVIAAGSGDAEALVSSGTSLTFVALARAAEKAARQLVTAGIRPGQVVALKGHPDAQLLKALHGVWKAGAIAFPMNPRWAAAEEERAARVLGPRLVLLGGGMTPVGGCENLALEEAEGGIRDSALAGIWPDTRPLPFQANPAAVPGGTPAAHLLTSGTLGEPKAVTLTFGNLRASARGARERLSLGPSDRWLASLSPAHVGGLALVSRAALLGSSMVFAGGFNAKVFLELVTEGVITHASLVPTMLHQFLDLWGNREAPPGLRCLLIGGARADENLVERALALRFPIALTFGLTEASSQVATAPPELVRAKPGTVGAPLPGVDLRISAGGEILVRGPIVAPGQEEEDGWLHTGDLGHLDPEGHLWVTGRVSLRIISGGVNVDPAEVEAVLRTYPGVKEVVVVGLPDDEWGERVVAALVSENPEGIHAEGLDRLARAVLSPPKRPRDFRVVDELPRNANGKVDRSRVRSLFD